MTTRFFGRELELKELQDRIKKNGSSFFAVKGRRRIGKSTLLRNAMESCVDGFYFFGIQGESNASLLRRFAAQWGKFSGSPLAKLAPRFLQWQEVVDDIKSHVASHKLVIVLDEIQWIHTLKNGFNGYLKDLWESTKGTRNIKIIISGSSRRYFAEHVENQNSTLYGLKTHGAIIVPPFSLDEVRRFYFPKWNVEQAALVYMMVGGIPYYLENVAYGDNFMRAVEQTFFVKSSLFLEEAREILSTEYRRRPMIDKVMLTLSALARGIVSEENLCKSIKVSQPNMNQILAFLLDLGFIHRTAECDESGRWSDKRYILNDFFLRFYFLVIEKNRARINASEDSVFYNYVIESADGYYIRNFSGVAFEALLRAHIVRNELFCPSTKPAKLFDRLEIKASHDYTVREFRRASEAQIDLVISDKTDRELRFIEVKWLSRDLTAKELAQNLDKTRTRAESYVKHLGDTSYARSFFVAVNRTRLVGHDQVIRLADLIE